MTLPKVTKEFLREHGIRIKKRLGQNFLIDEGILNRIVEVADLSRDDIVIEIGPGMGTLTKRLAEKAQKVLAIELDENLVRLLKETLKSYPNIEIIHADILKINLKQLVTRLPGYPVTRLKEQANWQTGKPANKVKVELLTSLTISPPLSSFTS